MKKFLIGMVVLSSLNLGTAMANSCDEPNFTDTVVEQAAENFILKKAKAQKVLKVETTFEKVYLTRKDKMILSVVKVLDSDNYEIEVECSKVQNQAFAAIVTYVNDGGIECTQDLKVMLESNLTNNGYKTIIKKNSDPVCL